VIAPTLLVKRHVTRRSVMRCIKNAGEEATHHGTVISSPLFTVLLSAAARLSQPSIMPGKSAVRVLLRLRRGRRVRMVSAIGILDQHSCKTAMSPSENKKSFVRGAPLCAIILGVLLPLSAKLLADVLSGRTAFVVALLVGQIPYIILALILKAQLSAWNEKSPSKKSVHGFRALGAAVPVVIPAFFVYYGIWTSRSGTSALAFFWLPVWQVLLMALGYYGGSMFGEFLSFLRTRNDALGTHSKE